MAKKQVRLTRAERLLQSRQFAANQLLLFYREKGMRCLGMSTSTRYQLEKSDVFAALGEHLQEQGIHLLQYTDDKDELASGVAAERVSTLAQLERILTENPDQQYLIDIPPVSIFANALEAARLTDGVVLIEKYGQTRHDAFERCLALMKQEAIRVCGVVTYQ